MIHGRIVVDAERCKGCELCGPACPQGVIELAATFNSSGYHPVQLVETHGQCTGCAVCALVCPEAAISVYRETRLSTTGLGSTRGSGHGRGRPAIPVATA